MFQRHYLAMIVWLLLLLTQVVHARAENGSSFDAAEKRGRLQFEQFTVLSDSTETDNGLHVELYWTTQVDDNVIDLLVVSNTQGWLGLGFSKNPGMIGADIAVVENKGGSTSSTSSTSSSSSDQWEVTDMLGIGHSEPKRDPKTHRQNFVLVDANRNVTHTWAHLRRSLESCDQEYDMRIGASDLYVIYAVGEDDSFEFHGPRCGSKLINLVSRSQPIETLPDTNAYISDASDEVWMVPADGSTKGLDILTSENFTLPDVGSGKYVQHVVNVTTPLQDGAVYTVLGFAQTTTAKSSSTFPTVVSHIDLLSCIGEPSFTNALHLEKDEYRYYEGLQNVPECTPYVSWMSGMRSPIILPRDSGMKLVGCDNQAGSNSNEPDQICTRYFVLRVFYELEDGESLANDIEPHGIRLFVTRAPRPNQDVGWFTMHASHDNIRIKGMDKLKESESRREKLLNSSYAGFAEYDSSRVQVSQVLCPSECTSLAFSLEKTLLLPPRVLAVNFHGREYLARARLSIRRDGGWLRDIAALDFYDSARQPSLHVDRTVLPGDDLVLTCEYDRARVDMKGDSTASISGGASRHQELCKVSIAMSPKPSRPMCMYSENVNDKVGCGAALLEDDAALKSVGIGNDERPVIAYELDTNAVDPPRFGSAFCQSLIDASATSPFALGIFPGILLVILWVMWFMTVWCYRFLLLPEHPTESDADQRTTAEKFCCGLLHSTTLRRWRRHFTKLDETGRRNVVMYIISVFISSITFVISFPYFVIPLTSGNEVMLSTDEDTGMMTAADDPLRNMFLVSFSIMAALYTLELIYRIRNNLSLLLHHLITVIVMGVIWLALVKTLDQYLAVYGYCLLLMGLLEQPMYIALLRYRMALVGTQLDAAARWLGFAAVYTIFIKGVCYAAAVYFLTRMSPHPQYLSSRHESDDIDWQFFGLVFGLVMSTILLMVQSWQVIVLWAIRGRAHQRAEAFNQRISKLKALGGSLSELGSTLKSMMRDNRQTQTQTNSMPEVRESDEDEDGGTTDAHNGDGTLDTPQAMEKT